MGILLILAAWIVAGVLFGWGWSILKIGGER
jgi:hypothetical protein